MRLAIQVKPNSKRPGIQKIGENSFKVSVQEPAKDGRANQAVIKALAVYLEVAPSNLRLVSGLKSKHKAVELTE